MIHWTRTSTLYQAWVILVAGEKKGAKPPTRGKKKHSQRSHTCMHKLDTLEQIK